MKEGNYVDEEIICLRGAYQGRTKSYDILKDKIFIRGKEIHFCWLSLFGGKFRMLMPEDFMLMPEKIAKARYISNYRPPVILTSSRYDENFGFHLMDIDTEDAGLDGMIQRMQNAVQIHAPETIVYGGGVIALEGMEGKWFEYKNFTLDEETYNIQFLIRSGSSMLVGTFNCRMIFYDEWKPLVFQSLEHIEAIGKGKGADESR